MEEHKVQCTLFSLNTRSIIPFWKATLRKTVPGKQCCIFHITQLKLGHCLAFSSFLHVSIPPVAVLPLSENLSFNSALQHFCRKIAIPVAWNRIKPTLLYKAALCEAVQNGSAKGPNKHLWLSLSYLRQIYRLIYSLLGFPTAWDTHAQA